MSNNKDELRLSVSKTKCFEQCKKQYEFSYILKFPKKERDYHILGKFCHKVLEDFHLEYLNGSKISYNIVMSKAFKAALIEYKDGITPEMKKECWKLIDQYLRIITEDKKNKLSANVIACEKNFQILIHDNVILNGMIDRIQIDHDDIIHVADYKTTKNKKYLKDDWFQLLTYAYVLLLENPDLKKIRASYILLRHDFEYLTKEFYPDEILKIKEKYISYADKIKQEKDFEPNPTYMCRYCDYSDICVEGKKMLDPSKTHGEITW